MQEVDWRGFRLPWIYTVDDDLFIRPAPPPSADSLSLEPWIVEDNWGEEIELERPTALPLDDEAQAELRSEEHTSELQSLMRISYAVFCLQKKQQTIVSPDFPST